MFVRGGPCVVVPLHKDGGYSGCPSQILPHRMSFVPARDVLCPRFWYLLITDSLCYCSLSQFLGAPCRHW